MIGLWLFLLVGYFSRWFLRQGKDGANLIFSVYSVCPYFQVRF